MYYVYSLVDPRNNLPFYIGKGKGSRASQHLWNMSREQNQYKTNKIKSIRESGMEPLINYIVEDIEDENLAYDIEKLMIEYYGRKGYDVDGILTNICSDARPPNHKGKTYEEIYGKAGAEYQRAKRSRLQKERGGYGPKQHSEESKEKTSRSVIAAHAARDCSHTDSTKKKIGESNSKYHGKDNKKSKCYELTNGNNTYTLYGGELSDFCKDNDLSLATFRRNLQDNWPPSKRGKNKGWIIKVKETVK